jgi:hypothetical protein
MDQDPKDQEQADQDEQDDRQIEQEGDHNGCFRLSTPQAGRLNDVANLLIPRH